MFPPNSAEGVIMGLLFGTLFIGRLNVTWALGFLRVCHSLGSTGPTAHSRIAWTVRAGGGGVVVRPPDLGRLLGTGAHSAVRTVGVRRPLASLRMAPWTSFPSCLLSSHGRERESHRSWPGLPLATMDSAPAPSSLWIDCLDPDLRPSWKDNGRLY